MKTVLIALLLFGSGLATLAYQTVWVREFRLIFGSSTPASAAVLAIFMGGLGAGGLILGAKADRQPHPLRFYGREFLRVRCDCYRALSDPRAELAQGGLAQFIANEPPPLEPAASTTN